MSLKHQTFDSSSVSDPGREKRWQLLEKTDSRTCTTHNMEVCLSFVSSRIQGHGRYDARAYQYSHLISPRAPMKHDSETN